MLQKAKKEFPELKGTSHFFCGREEDAKKILDLGFYLSFNGVITFAHDWDKIIENAPLDKILLETDAPYLTPIPYRNKRNEPVFVIEVAKRIAEIKKKPPKALLNGEKIMTILNIKPGVEVGKVIARLREAQLSGRVNTKLEARKFLQKLSVKS